MWGHSSAHLRKSETIWALLDSKRTAPFIKSEYEGLGSESMVKLFESSAISLVLTSGRSLGRAVVDYPSHTEAETLIVDADARAVRLRSGGLQSARLEPHGDSPVPFSTRCILNRLIQLSSPALSEGRLSRVLGCRKLAGRQTRVPLAPAMLGVEAPGDFVPAVLGGQGR